MMFKNLIYFQKSNFKHYSKSTITARLPHFTVLISLALIAVLASACTTAHRSSDCSPHQLKNLQRHYSKTSAEIRKNKTALTSIRLVLNRQNCQRGLFGTGSITDQCQRLSAQAKKLQDSINNLEKRQYELKAASEGRKHSGTLINGCVPNWVSQTKPKASKQRRAASSAPLKAKRISAVRPVTPAKPVPDIIVGPYDTEDRSKATMEETQSSDQGAHISPVRYEIKPRSEPTLKEKSVELLRNFTADPRVRKVGSSFFPDQSEPGDRPVPVHEADQ